MILYFLIMTQFRDWAKESVRKMDSLGIMRGVITISRQNQIYNGAVGNNNAKKLFNLDVSDYTSNVYEVKINGDLSLLRVRISNG